jgi:hypothetical protein
METGMKKGIIVLFIISTFFPCIVSATYHLDGFMVQNRTYENGSQLNRLQFSVSDSNNKYPSSDVMKSFVITDPKGNPVSLINPVSFNTIYETNSNYDVNTGNYEYQFYRYCYYKADISALLIPGVYHLTFTDVDGETSKKNYTFNAIVDLPFIPSNSYSYYIDQDGNFIWQWKMPNIDSSISTSIKVGVFISIYGDKNEYLGELFIYVPTQLGKMVVPKDIFNQLLTMGKKFILGALIKTSDNNNRAYSNGVLLPSLISQPTACVATLYSGLSLHLPYISYASDVSLLADFIYDYNPLYPNLIIFKLTNASVIDNSLFSCTASSLNNNLSIHIPNVLLPDETTHLWVDLEYSRALSIDGNFYWVVSNYGTVSN